MGMSINSSRDQLDREDSFSFTCYDLINSAPAVLFSEDDDFASADDDDDDDDEESYIEIALGNDDDGESEEFELRISLSTTADHTKIPDNPGFETDTIPETTPSSLSSSSPSTFTFSCSSTGACSLAGVPSEMGEESFHPNQNREKLIDINPWELVRSRKKASKNTAAILNGAGGITRFFIKFRAIKVRNLVASFVKPLQVISSQGKSEHKKKRSKEIIQYYQRLIKPFDKWTVQRNHQGNDCNNNNNNNKKDIKSTSFGGGEKYYSRVLEINLDPIRGVLEAVSMGIGRKDRQTRSCPTSIKSSPLHRATFPSESKVHTTDNSIEAAIAHCKTSFAQASHF